MMRRSLHIAASLFTSALVAASSAEAGPSRVAVVREAQPDALMSEVTTRLSAELAAAGFEVILVDATPLGDPRVQVEGAAVTSSRATMAIVRVDESAAADVWIADHTSHRTLVRRIDLDATREPISPAALAIHAVELLRAHLLEVAVPAPLEPPPPPATSPPPLEGRSRPAKAPPKRALFGGLGFEIGLAALYGFGETRGRLAPTLRLSYGGSIGLSGRLSVVGPTATDQLALLELTYALEPWRQTIVPIVSLGAGAAHAHIENSGTGVPPIQTEAWAAALGGSAGVAVRPSDRAAFLFDVHALFLKPGPGAIIGGELAHGEPALLVIASVGVAAGL
jgi:hypothetical protein